MTEPRPPTATQIDKACREGFFVFYSNRQQVLGAVDRRRFDLPVKNKVWIHRASDLAWEYVDASTVIITTETFGRRRNQTMGVKGKPAGTVAPGRQTGPKVKKDGAKAPAKADGTAEPKKPKGGTVIVSRIAGKQGELPGVETSKRKIVEIEDLAEIYDDKKAAKIKATDAYKDAEENLAVSMKKHGRTSYSRKTWGRVVLKESKEHVTFKRDKG